MCYKVRKSRKGGFRREPVERTDREIIVLSLPHSEL